MLAVVLGMIVAMGAVLLGAWATYGTLRRAVGPRERSYAQRICLAGWGAVLLLVGSVLCFLQQYPRHALILLVAALLMAPFAVYRVSWRRQLIRAAEKVRSSVKPPAA